MCAGARSWARKGGGRPLREDRGGQRSRVGERSGPRHDCGGEKGLKRTQEEGDGGFVSEV